MGNRPASGESDELPQGHTPSNPIRSPSLLLARLMVMIIGLHLQVMVIRDAAYTSLLHLGKCSTTQHPNSLCKAHCDADQCIAISSPVMSARQGKALQRRPGNEEQAAAGACSHTRYVQAMYRSDSKAAVVALDSITWLNQDMRRTCPVNEAWGDVRRLTTGFALRGLSHVGKVEQGATAAVPDPVFCFFLSPAPTEQPQHQAALLASKNACKCWNAMLQAHTQHVFGMLNCDIQKTQFVASIELLVVDHHAAHTQGLQAAQYHLHRQCSHCPCHALLCQAEIAPAWDSFGWSGSLPAYELGSRDVQWCVCVCVYISCSSEQQGRIPAPSVSSGKGFSTN